MPRWLWFAPLSGLVLAMGLLAYRQGMIVAQTSETDVIETYTARYIESHGALARPTDCEARPGRQKQVWIVVTCTSPQGRRVDYPVDRLGRLLKVDAAKEPLDAPET